MSIPGWRVGRSNPAEYERLLRANTRVEVRRSFTGGKHVVVSSIVCFHQPKIVQQNDSIRSQTKIFLAPQTQSQKKTGPFNLSFLQNAIHWSAHIRKSFESNDFEREWFTRQKMSRIDADENVILSRRGNTCGRKVSTNGRAGERIRGSKS
jgi:hypothetical protein